MADACARCHYYLAGSETHGACHRSPPSVMQGQGVAWPRIEPGNWCGEFVALGAAPKTHGDAGGPRITLGSFTAAPAVKTTVLQPDVRANSVVVLQALGSAAAFFHVVSQQPGASFTVATRSGLAAAGTEKMQYVVFSPR